MKLSTVETIQEIDNTALNASIPTYSELVDLLKNVREEVMRENINGYMVHDMITSAIYQL